MDKNDITKEIDALKNVLNALSPLTEEQRNFVVSAAATRLGITFKSAKKEISPEDCGEEFENDKALTVKQFLAKKKPLTVVERITCLAYYLTHNLETSHFKTVELTKLNTKAAGQKISNPALFARNAVSQNGYFAPAGGGRKQITALGEAIVGALPNRDKVATVLSEMKKPQKKKRKAKKSKGKE